MNTHKNSGWWLFLRALLPSTASFAVGFVLAVIIIGLHLFLLSNDQSNLLLPHLTGVNNDQLADVYKTTIQNRLDHAFENSDFGVLLTALVWGTAGWLVYTVADFIFSNIRDLRSSDKNITMPRKNEVINHPLYNQIIIRLIWRFFVGILLIVLTLALSPLISELFKNDIAFLKSSTPQEMAKLFGITLISWIAIFHAYVVLFRLFVLRTRVFGEIIY